MQVIFTSRAAESSQLRDPVVQRVQFVMRRMTWLVPRASVQMSDINGPRGGVDKRCQVQFATDRTGTVLVTSVARDWRTALDSALSRAVRVLIRAWRRTREPRTPSRRAIAHDS